MTTIAALDHYISISPRIGLRAWHRRKDRSAIEAWPPSPVPAHWTAIAEPSGDRVAFAVDHIESGRLIGRITLRDIASEGARLGIVLEPGFTGQGYGREALAIFCRHIFHSVGLAALWLDVASDNQRAIRCYVASGFRVVGTAERGGYGYVEMERRA